MKKNVLFGILALLLLAQPIAAQNKFGISFQYNSGEFIYFKPLIGTSSVNSEWALGFGADYGYKLNKHFWFETGFSYLKVNSEITPAFTGEEVLPYSVQTSWLDFPALLRADPLSWFYVKTGLDFVMQLSNTGGVSDQTGVGAQFAFGFDIPFSKSIHLELESGLKVLSLLPFSGGSNQRHYVDPFLNVRISYWK